MSATTCGLAWAFSHGGRGLASSKRRQALMHKQLSSLCLIMLANVSLARVSYVPSLESEHGSKEVCSSLGARTAKIYYNKTIIVMD